MLYIVRTIVVLIVMGCFSFGGSIQTNAQVRKNFRVDLDGQIIASWIQEAQDQVTARYQDMDPRRSGWHRPASGLNKDSASQTQPHHEFLSNLPTRRAIN